MSPAVSSVLWWAIYIVLGVFCSAFVVAVFYRTVQMIVTAYVIVLPWDMGFDESEIDENLKLLVSVGQTKGVKVSYAELRRRYLNYRKALERRLRTSWARCMVLVDYAEHEDQSLERMATLLRWNPYRRVFIVETRGGRPEPKEVSWSQTCAELHRLGLRKIIVFGCLYGTRDGEALSSSDIPFGVNFTADKIRETGLFDEVEIDKSVCFTHEVTKVKQL